MFLVIVILMLAIILSPLVMVVLHSVKKIRERRQEGRLIYPPVLGCFLSFLIAALLIWGFLSCLQNILPGKIGG
jgi:ABC-type polysaccharide transport system permease subunit